MKLYFTADPKIKIINKGCQDYPINLLYELKLCFAIQPRTFSKPIRQQSQNVKFALSCILRYNTPIN